MKLAEATKILKRETMACLWPNGSHPGQKHTDLAGIAGEVKALLQGIKDRQGMAGAAFFVLDDDNPESALYDELGSAYMVFRNAALGIS